jgi:hypothetical protein
MSASPILDDDGTVNDGTSILTSPPCKDADRTQWTYNYGIMIAGAAYMYNYTNGAPKWDTALRKMLTKSDQFFPAETGGVMVEICEHSVKCNADQESFKAYLGRWYGATIQMAPFTHDIIMPKLLKSAVRAAQTCTGPSQHNGGPYQCGMRWYMDGFDGTGGVGPQMSALNIISVLNAARTPPPYSSVTGGVSQGNPNLGTQVGPGSVPIFQGHVTAGDKAGAALLTLLVAAGMLGGGWWMIFS